MYFGAKSALFALFGTILAQPLLARADDLQRVLEELNTAAKSFHTTSADFKFDSKQTLPVPDEEIQTGTVYYERSGPSFKMGVHVAKVDNRDVPKVIVCCVGGKIQMYEKLTNTTSTLDKFSQYQSWFMLGFGASGTDLEEKWDITYGGPETIDGVRTEKLILVAKDQTVRRNIAQVTVWMDTRRGVSLRQLFDQGGGQSRDCHYTGIKVNQTLPANAFTLDK
ncbi:MAG: hypothetical protein ABSD70_15495 [Terracidiphilus sp.]|jgi:outer membrane lipoprotein-sorting protein